MASEWSYKNQNSSYGVNFSEILVKRKDSDSSRRLHAHSLGWLKAAGKTRVRLKVLLVFSVTRYLSLLQCTA